MKRHFIFYILSLIFLFPLPAVAVETITANPINIASRLILYTDSAKVANTLEYYGYELSSENSNSHNSASAGLSSSQTTVYRHPNGTIIRFTFPKTETKQTFPTVQVLSKIRKNEAEKILKELDYKRTATGYETNSSQYDTHITSCKFGPGKTITFQRLKK